MRYSASLLGLMAATALMVPAFQLPGLSEEPQPLPPAALAQTQTPETEGDPVPKSLLQEGRALYYQGNFTQALEVLQAALDQYQALDDAPERDRGEVESLITIAEVYLWLEQYDEALNLANQALALAQSHQDVVGEVWALNIMGVAQRNLGNTEESLELHQQAIPLAQTSGDAIIQGVTFINLGAVYASQGNFATAQEQFRQSLELLQQPAPSAEAELQQQYYQALAFQWAGWGAFSTEDFDRAADFFGQSIVSSGEIGSRVVEAGSLYWLGNAYQNLEQYPQALEIYQQALTAYQALEKPADVGFSLSRMGEIYRAQEQYEQAVDIYQQAATAFEQAADRYNQAESLYWLGSAYQDLEQYPQSLAAYQQALVLYQELERPSDIGYTLKRIGDIYSSQQQNEQAQSAYQQAREAYQQALEQSRLSADLGGQATMLISIGHSYWFQGKNLSQSGAHAESISLFQQSLLPFQQAQELAAELGRSGQEQDAIQGILISHMNIGWAYGSQQKYPEAITAWQQVLATLQSYQARLPEADFLEERMDILGQLGIAYHNNSQYTESIQSHQESAEIANSLGDFSEQVQQLNFIATRYNYLNQYEQALATSEQAIKIVRDQIPQEREAEMGLLVNLGQTYDSLGQYDRALENYQQALVIAKDLEDLGYEISSLNNIGVVHSNIGQYLQALEPLQQAWELNQAAITRLQTEGASVVALLCDETTASLGVIGQQYCLARFQNRESSLLSNLGSVYSGLGRYAEAIEVYQRSLVYQQENQNRYAEVTVLGNIGTVYATIGDYSKAIDAHQHALQIARIINSRSHEATALNNLGYAYSGQGQYFQALEHYQQGLVVARAISEPSTEATILDNMGSIYSYQGKLTEALSHYQASLEIRQQLGETIITNLNNIALAYDAQGQIDQALEYLQQSLEIARNVGDRTNEATILSNIAGLYANRADYAKALELQQQASSIQQELGGSSNQWSALAGLGQLYYRLGQYDQALDYYQQALQISRQTGEKLSEASSLSFLGGIYWRQEQFDLALEQMQASLRLTQEMGDIVSESRNLVAIGRIYQQQGKPDQAVALLEQALKIQREVGVRPDEGGTLTVLGLAYGSQGNLAEATATLQQAIVIHQETGNRAAEAETLANLGEVLAETQPELAIVFYKQSVDVRESIRGDIRSLDPSLQQSFTDTVADDYRTLADLLLQKNRILEAQQILDLLKVQELEEYLHNVRGNAQTASGIEYIQPEQAIIARYQQLQENAIALSQELAQLEDKKRAGQITPAEDQRRSELTSLREQLKGQFNDFIDSPDIQTLIQQLRFEGDVYDQTLNLDALDRQVTRMTQLNAVLFYPLILEDRLELVVVAPNTQPIRRTVEGVGRQRLNQVITEFRQALESPNEDAQTPAQQLYRWLIEPLEADLAAAGIETIIYAPDGALRYIPLAALHDGEQWLVQRFAVNNITAISLENAGDTDRSATDLRILAGAFANEAAVYSPEPAQGDQYYGLAFAGEEVRTLQAQMPNTIALYDNDFSLAEVLDEMGSVNILHFATHAAVVRDASQSFILFGNGDAPTLRDIEGWALDDIDLVVLSACETGLGGYDNNGEQILGLGYQFQSEGAGAVVASLWQVSDGGTQVLMNAFYAALQAGHTKAAALQLAQQAMISGELDLPRQDTLRADIVSTRNRLPQAVSDNLDHPYYWAPFILIGNGL